MEMANARPQEDEIIVSYVVTVYNKEPYIGYTVQSLLTQEGGFRSEYIFVDDVSKDRSVDIIAQATKDVPDVTIVRNTVNRGPSIRLNQGAKMARGRYIQFIDSDDVMSANATAVMIRLMEQYNADVVHGSWERTNMKSAELVGRRLDDNAPCKVSDNPLEFVFKERIRRMCQMIRRDTFLASGGSDEGVFIQDESLALRLARVSKRFVLLDAPVILIPALEGELSRNTSQLNHDRFLASYHMLTSFPSLDEAARRRLYRRCVSARWKQERLMKGTLRAAFSTIFLRYLYSTWFLMPVDEKALRDMHRFFTQLQGVHRTAPNG